MWYGGGHPCSHSMLVVVSSTIATSRLDAKASQIIKIISITAVSEINDPMEETVFQVVYASG